MQVLLAFSESSALTLWQEPHVMHAVLAVAASHYRYHLKSPRQRCTCEIFHSIKAASGLRQCLGTLLVANIDAAMTTSMFLGSLSFANATDDFQVPLKSRPLPFYWLGNQLGVRSLVSLFRSNAGAQSMWLRVFEENSEAFVQLEDCRSGTDGIPEEFVTLFDVVESSTCASHPYLTVLRRLCRLLYIDPENDLALFSYTQFVEGMSPQFVGLLNTLDTRALMLLSYWLGLLCVKDCWWSRVRANLDCWAICEHLEKYGDELLWRYMDFPAQACGYSYTTPSGLHLVDWFRKAPASSV